MRARLLICFLMAFHLHYAQSQRDLITVSFDDVPLEAILDTLSVKTGYFFSYNSEIFPKGSRYTISAEDMEIGELLDRLLIGTNLQHSFFKDQIILNFKSPEKVTDKKNRKSLALVVRLSMK